MDVRCENEDASPPPPSPSPPKVEECAAPPPLVMQHVKWPHISIDEFRARYDITDIDYLGCGTYGLVMRVVRRDGEARFSVSLKFCLKLKGEMGDEGDSCSRDVSALLALRDAPADVRASLAPLHHYFAFTMQDILRMRDTASPRERRFFAVFFAYSDDFSKMRVGIEHGNVDEIVMLQCIEMHFVRAARQVAQLQTVVTDPADATSVVLSAARALRYIHSLGIVHNDLQITNLLLQRADEAAAVTATTIAGANWTRSALKTVIIDLGFSCELANETNYKNLAYPPDDIREMWRDSKREGTTLFEPSRARDCYDLSGSLLILLARIDECGFLLPEKKQAIQLHRRALTTVREMAYERVAHEEEYEKYMLLVEECKETNSPPPPAFVKTTMTNFTGEDMVEVLEEMLIPA